ncbi:MAG: glycosyl hydrolase [Salana multivorans]|uniref:glycoside hydrolase 5 family protein n=1 Tax=Salana multivorans TaxID=120377 RepID=UPI00095B6053|nr:glycosyl hydrolase [Salana multivorans]MBN8883513.1 glycosyl hydrolase [Salana multivorans]OJX96028.1 MAG: glycosyl hydrolase [Micrococcales bacterium 73-15]
MPRPRIGVNYTPSRDWMFQWIDLDPEVVRRDFAAIAGLGLDHVRVFPLWPVLQPNRTLIRRQAVDDVATVVEIGAAAGLTVYVDVIQGHMSGFDFVPAWLVNWHRGNMFTDPDAIAAQGELVRVLLDRLAPLPGFGGLTLGNECNQFVAPPNPDYMGADPDQVTGWLAGTIGTIPEGTPGTFAHSTNDHVWYRDGHPFVPRHVTEHGNVSTVHSWIFNGTAARYGGLSPESINHGEYLLQLARAFSADPSRPVWLQEIGAPDNCLSDEEMPAFLVGSLESALTTRDLYGVTWWCSHDIDPGLSDFKSLEYGLGLMRPDQSVKPVGRALAEAVAALPDDLPQPPRRSVAVVIEVDDDGVPLSRAALAPGGPTFETWHRLRASGTYPALVTGATAASPDQLAARGVTRLVESPR